MITFPISVLAKLRVQYQTIKGDTISDITWALVPGRLYGKNGNLKKVKLLNPSIKNPKHLTSGTILFLPEESHYVIEQINQFGLDHVNPNFRNQNEVLSRLRFLKNFPIKTEVTEINHSDSAQDRKPTSEEAQFTQAVAQKIKVEMNPTQNTIPSSLTTLEFPKKEMLSKISKEKNEEQRSSWLELSPNYKMTGLRLIDSATNLRSNLVTNLFITIDLLYIQKISENFQSFIGGKFGYVSFSSPKGSTKTLIDSSHFLTGIKLGGSAKIFSDFTFTGFFQYNNELFGRAASTSSLSVDSVPVPSVEGKLSWDALHFQPFIYGLSAFFTEYFSTQSGVTYTISQGQGYGGSIYIKQMTGSQTPPFETQAGFLSRSQNTSNINQTETIYFFNLRFYIPFLNKEGERMK